ncbi:MAG: hypothetical protein WBP58_10755 [Chitinophagaceae bacterium]
MKKTLLLSLLTVLTFITACKKNDPATNTDSEFYYEATIDGAKYKVSAPPDNANPDFSAGSGLTALGFDATYTSNISDYRPNGTGMFVSKGILIDYLTSTDQEFRNFFAPGIYNYAPTFSEGVTIAWADKAGKIWVTDNAPEDQTGSSFRIISSEDSPGDIRGRLYVKTKIQFNCKLYDEAGNVKQASGTYVGLFGKVE